MLYFLFEKTDDHKQDPVSAIRSLVYQLYMYFAARGSNTHLTAEIRSRQQGSAQPRSTNYETLWAIFRTVVSSQNLSIMIILDALDESNGFKSFARDLKNLVGSQRVKVAATSRKEADHVKIFEGLDTMKGSSIIEVTGDDVRRDIVSYLRAKV